MVDSVSVRLYAEATTKVADAIDELVRKATGDLLAVTAPCTPRGHGRATERPTARFCW